MQQPGSGNGNRGKIVNPCPEQILYNFAERRAGQMHRFGHRGQRTAYQSHVGGLDCDIRARADSDADIGLF